MLPAMERSDLIDQRESFLGGVLGGVLALALAEPIGAALGIGDPSTGRFVVVSYAAIPVAIVAALLSRRWRGVGGLLVGFAVAGGVAGVVGDLGTSGDVVTDVIASGLIVMLSMGVFGASAYLATMAVIRVVARRRARVAMPPGPASAAAGEGSR